VHYIFLIYICALHALPGLVKYVVLIFEHYYTTFSYSNIASL